MDQIISLIQPYAETAVVISLVTLVASIFLIPMVVVRLPANYFVNPDKRLFPRSHPLFRFTLMVIKNSLGVFLLLAGIIMLFTPGQGLLTIAVSLIILDYPQKYQLERKLFARPHIHKTLNWIRQRYGNPPLIVPDEGPE